jgi:hypothetical protein
LTDAYPIQQGSNRHLYKVHIMLRELEQAWGFAKKRHILKRVKNNHCSIKRRINMTQQPNEQNNNNELPPQIEKLLIDNDSMNFPFHAAYLVYEEAFEKATEAQAKTELNQNIQDLKENKIDLETFYRNLAPFRKLDVPRQERFSMQTQRKKDWRKKTQRQERIKRHKK